MLEFDFGTALGPLTHVQSVCVFLFDGSRRSKAAVDQMFSDVGGTTL